MFSVMLASLLTYLAIGALCTWIRCYGGARVPLLSLVLWGLLWPLGLVLIWMSDREQQ
jgi:hypothetical protein